MSSFRPDFFFDSQTWVSISGSKAEKSPFLTDPDPDPSEVADGVPQILDFLLAIDCFAAFLGSLGVRLLCFLDFLDVCIHLMYHVHCVLIISFDVR